MENKNYNFALEDTRTPEEKAQDFPAKDLLTMGSPIETFRQVVSPLEAKSFIIRSQDGSGSCVAQSMAKMFEVALIHQLGETDNMYSSSTIYPFRSNRPEAGMVGGEALQILQKNTSCLEKYLASQNMNDAQMDAIKLPLNYDSIKKKVDLSYYIDWTYDFDEVAQYVAKNGACQIFIKSDYENWCKDIPTIGGKAKGNVSHAIAVVDSITWNGVKYLVIEDSWGKFGGMLGERGQRLITKEFFMDAIFFCGTIIIHKYSDDKTPIEDTTIEPCKYGDKSFAVLKWQNFLINAGYFPKNIPHEYKKTDGTKYGNFLSITAKATLQWQLDNKVDTPTNLKALGGKYVGAKTIKKVNELKSKSNSNLMQNYSLTQGGNILQIVAFATFILNQMGYDITQDHLSTIVMGVIGIVGFLLSWVGRYRKGDLNILGFRK